MMIVNFSMVPVLYVTKINVIVIDQNPMLTIINAVRLIDKNFILILFLFCFKELLSSNIFPGKHEWHLYTCETDADCGTNGVKCDFLGDNYRVCQCQDEYYYSSIEKKCGTIRELIEISTFPSFQFKASVKNVQKMKNAKVMNVFVKKATIEIHQINVVNRKHRADY